MSSKHVRKLQRAIERVQAAAETGPASQIAVEAAEPVGGSQTAAQPPREHRRWGCKWWHGYRGHWNYEAVERDTRAAEVSGSLQ